MNSYDLKVETNRCYLRVFWWDTCRRRTWKSLESSTIWCQVRSVWDRIRRLWSQCSDDLDAIEVQTEENDWLWSAPVMNRWNRFWTDCHRVRDKRSDQMNRFCFRCVFLEYFHKSCRTIATKASDNVFLQDYNLLFDFLLHCHWNWVRFPQRSSVGLKLEGNR